MAARGVDGGTYQARPAPLLAGAVGYIGYEAAYFIEQLPDLGADDLALPDVYLMFVDVVMAHCHATGQSYLSVLGRGGSEQTARRQAIERRDAILHRLETFESDPPPCPGPDPSKVAAARIDVKRHFDRAGYCRAVIAPKLEKFRKVFADRLKSPPGVR